MASETSNISNAAFGATISTSSSGEVLPLMMDIKDGGYKSTASGTGTNKALISHLASALSDSDDDGEEHAVSDEQKTNQMETFLHLVKGYMGAGCLSLPWAVSQLGISGGILAIFVMSLWTSYNCYVVVRLKRYVEQSQQPHFDETASGASSATTNTNITYPDVGEWAYGKHFHSYVTTCICVQQLAICTVFISFVGENLLAVLVRMHITSVTHVGVMTVALPVVLGLSFIPNLKTLAPVMAAGALMLFLAFVTLGVVVEEEWAYRPTVLPSLHPPSVPLALCAILYSYEGICLILPVESAMKEPQHFQKIFTGAMVCVACMLAGVASICVLAFGNVTSGSVTAFLVEAYQGDPTVTRWLMLSNTAVSLSVLLTYPLQLFPALELMGPWLSRVMSGVFKGADPENENDDLSAFEPLPPLPEDDVASLESLTSEHHYPVIDVDELANKDKNAEDDEVSFSAVSSVTSFFPIMTMPGDSPQLRATLVLLTYSVAVIVPNVQALISLAGALAGSSTALLIPPALELAWIRHLERDLTKDADDEGDALSLILDPATGMWRRFVMERVKCYVLLAIGLIFMGIGTYASISDIIRIYLSSE